MKKRKQKKSTVKIPVLTVFLFSVFTCFMQIITYIVADQPFGDTLLISLTSCGFILSLSNTCLFFLSATCVFIFSCIDFYSWYYIEAPINQNVIDAINPFQAIKFINVNGWKGFSTNIIYIILAFTFYLGFPYLMPRERIRLQIYTFVCIVYIEFTLLFIYINKFNKEYRPPQKRSQFFARKEGIWPPMETVFKNAEKKINTSFKNAKKRNIIILALESFEIQCVGRYSNHYPNAMPYLNSIIDNHTHFNNVNVQKYQTWSVGSYFGAFCNLPLVSTSKHLYTKKSRMHKAGNFHCLGDYLKEAGYHNELYADCDLHMGGLGRIFTDHGFDHAHDWREVRHDIDLFKRVENEAIPRLINISKKKPFCLVLQTSDTHPFFTVSCKVRKHLCNSKWYETFDVFDCADQFVEHFVHVLESYNMQENTELIVYGDHPLFGRYLELSMRKLIFLFPWRAKKTITKPVTIYDFAPTVLSLLDIEYKPKFVYGADMFSSDIGAVPDDSDFSLLFDMFNDK